MSLTFHYNKDLPTCTPLKQKYLQEQVKVLKNIFQPEQKSKEWYEMRNNMLTASDWGTVLGENHYSNSNEVLKKKCGDDTFITNAAMQWGNKYESVAVLIYEHRNEVNVLEFGCLQHPFIPFLGASPDGITNEGVMLEIKCPTSRKITGIPPSYYWCQVQGQLEVCELDRCDFLECSIKEYSDENMYLEDNYQQNYYLNKFMNEKGVVAEFYRRSTKTLFYEYSPVCLIDNELQNWKNYIIDKYNTNDVNGENDIIFSCFSYWYLEEVSCVPIYRNQEWFNKAKPELELFWNKVLKYRELGLDKLLYDINKEKEDKKKLKLEQKEETMAKKNINKKEKKESKESINKKQKKIKEFIILDNDNMILDNNNNIDNSSQKSTEETSTDDDYYSDEFISSSKISMFTEINDDIEIEKTSNFKLSMFSD
jgi:putative phage-type endonuclease